MLILHKGRLIAVDQPKSLIHREIGYEVIEFSVAPSELEYFVKKIKDRFPYQIINDRLRLYLKKDQDGRAVLNLIASDNITLRRSSLNDVFLKLVGYEVNDRWS